MKRGEVWWAEVGPPAGRRPVLLLSRNEAYAVRELVMVAPLTTRIRGIPSEVSLGDEDGVPRPVSSIWTLSPQSPGSACVNGWLF